MITRAAFLTVFVRTRPGYTQQIQNTYKLHLHYNWQHITISWQAYPLQNLHRPWTVVRSCPGLTTVMLWSTVLQTTANSIKKLQWVQNNKVSDSVGWTVQIGSFSVLKDDPTPACCWGCYTGCLFSRGSSTKWLCSHSKFSTSMPSYLRCLMQDRQCSHNLRLATTMLCQPSTTMTILFSFFSVFHFLVVGSMQ